MRPQIINQIHMRKYFYLSLVFASVFIFAGCSFLYAMFGGSQPPMGAEEETSVSDEIIKSDIQREKEKASTGNEDIQQEKEKASISDEDIQSEKEEKPAIENVFKGTWTLQFSIDKDTMTSELFVKTGSFDEEDHYRGVIDTMKSSLYYADSGETEVTGANPASAKYEIDGQNITITSSDGGAYYEGIINVDQPNPVASGACNFLGAQCSWTMEKKE